MISTIAMVKLGKTYGNLMMDVQGPTLGEPSIRRPGPRSAPF
jgi:hypothetical protein